MKNRMEDIMQEGLLKKSKLLNLKTESLSLFKSLRLVFSRLIMWAQSLKMKALSKLEPTKQKLQLASSNMIGSMEKGIEAAQLTAPPVGTFEGVDLSIMPKYICFKAALLKEKVL